MTKVIIQIPCFNEAQTLGRTLADLPRAIPGADVVEWLIVDDGSTDNTVAVAKAGGVDHVIRAPCNQGLARAFLRGIQACVQRGADVIVNTDADNQYCADDIPKLVEPILAGQAEIVVGARPVSDIAHFSPLKKMLQKLGSWVVRVVSRTSIPDAPSGFRAISRDAAMRLNVFNEYTYTLETIIQAGQKNMAIISVPIRTNEELRPSRLVKSVPSYVRRSMITILRIFVTYRPFEFFAVPAAALLIAGIAIDLRFLYYYLFISGAGKIQSLILGATLIAGGLLLFVVGILSDLISVNRKLLEKMDYRLQKLEEATPAPPADRSGPQTTD